MKCGYDLQLSLVEKIDISSNKKSWIFSPKITKVVVKSQFYLVNTK